MVENGAMKPFEVEDRGLDMKLQASANGAYDPVKAGETDDDGRYPKRSGTAQSQVALQY